MDPIFGPLARLVNIPKSHVQGFELSAVLRPFDGLRIAPTIDYNKTEIDEYVGLDGRGIVRTARGSVPANSRMAGKPRRPVRLSDPPKTGTASSAATSPIRIGGAAGSATIRKTIFPRSPLSTCVLESRTRAGASPSGAAMSRTSTIG